MKNYHFLNLRARISSLYAPEICCEASSNNLAGKEISIEGSIDGNKIAIIQAQGCIPNRDNTTLRVVDDVFSFTLAWHDSPKIYSSWVNRLHSLFGGLFPFISMIINLHFSGVGYELTTAMHVELPHFITRYTRDTLNLQHVFTEGGLKTPSFMGGICNDNESFQMHLHYKSLDAFRRITTPILTMIAVMYLDLATILAGGKSWRDNPIVILGILSINTTTFATLAAIRVGSTLRSLLNMVRFAAVFWVIVLTISIRSGRIPKFELFLDFGLKACVVWIAMMFLFSFLIYPVTPQPKQRESSFAIVSLFGLITWVGFLFVDQLSSVTLFSNALLR